MKKITMLYINGDSAEFKDVVPSLTNYYELIKCACIDIVSICFQGKNYDVICDDESLLRQPPYTFSVISEDGFPMIAGNILVCNSEKGKEKSLSTSDVIRLAGALCWTSQNGKAAAALIAD